MPPNGGRRNRQRDDRVDVGTGRPVAAVGQMTLADFVEDVADRRKTLVVYASDEAPDVTAHFETRNVTVEREPLVAGGPPGFVVLRDEDGFVGAFCLETMASLLEPPVFRPWHRDEVSEPWRSLYEILNNTLFSSFDRRQLLAATREIENRAWRIGAGTLRVGFQSRAAFEDQVDVYRRFVDETDLTLHVYVADADGPSLPGIDVFSAPDTEIGDYWFLAYDAAGDPLNACGLVAMERQPDAYTGFWTYEADRVAALSTYLEETYE